MCRQILEIEIVRELTIAYYALYTFAGFNLGWWCKFLCGLVFWVSLLREFYVRLHTSMTTHR